jgi:hypothetical protein
MLKPLIRILRRIVHRICRNKGFVLYPSIKKKDELDHLLYKLSFMFPNRKIFYSGLDKSSASKPGYLGDIKLSASIYHVSPAKVFFFIFTFRIVLIWDCKTGLLRKLTRLPHVFDIDYKRNRVEGWQYFNAYNLVARPTSNVGLKTNKKFYGGPGGGFSKEPPGRRRHPQPKIDATLAGRDKTTPENFFNFEMTPKKDKCYAFGTGESLDTAYDYDFSDGYKIVCNTMIKNIELMTHIKPDFLVFADAIYHFGPSIYAFAFRNALSEFVSCFPSCIILIPELLYYHFIHNNPGLEKKVYLVPLCKHREVNNDLKKEYCYHRFENILNLLILPLASTLADNIYFLGFDGRSKSSKRFWEYSKKNNFIDLLPLQESAHPGFFVRGDYESYTEELAEQTEMIMQHGENMGKSYYSLNASHNKAMKKRLFNQN